MIDVAVALVYRKHFFASTMMAFCSQIILIISLKSIKKSFFLSLYFKNIKSLKSLYYLSQYFENIKKIKSLKK